MSAPLVIGIDLGGTNCRGGLVTASGALVSSRRMATETGEGLEPFLQHLVRFCGDLIADAGDGGQRVAGIGIGTPGVISSEGVVQISPNLSVLNGFPLARELENRLGLPVRVVNDANAIAWGEGEFGAGRPFSSFVALTLGTGVGGGLVLHRRLWLGSDGSAGEIGHVMVDAEGRLCGCGNRGCLEQYASAKGIVLSYRNLVERKSGNDPPCSGWGGSDGGAVALAEAARRGDLAARASFAEAGRRLGQVLGGVANLLNLDGVVFCGGVSGSLDLILPDLEDELAHRAFAIPGARLRIVAGELGEQAGIVGAAALALELLEEDGFSARAGTSKEDVDGG
ncbi:putative N-terminal HTH domain-containing sugar kinase of the NBD/HSP70 family [Desulfuromonas soudanensis]|uniref:Putative N-terminal HTH domain-containing sugar kinase of the NBD/HSP70 family n=1 Tax=Desulfuromonas soudanensis TaxID=1603606 RepID=A0A0M4D704_9BACT|nr:ROK family protein [Desulfuromonas soudanensis]ALC16822.1 putative N-terminal HTH domain-containing sugar kinase of the NBD/HSP70 family [Desulfuromonas soudanensis]